MRKTAHMKYSNRQRVTGGSHQACGKQLQKDTRRALATPVGLGLLLAACATGVGASEKEVRDSVALGALVFAENCSSCHQMDGYGEEGLYPSLRDPELLADTSLLIRTILHGRTRNTATGKAEPQMPSLDYLTNREIAAIIAFISGSWGEDVLVVTEEEIVEAR